MTSPEGQAPSISPWRHFSGDFLIYATAKALAGVSSLLVLRFLTSAMDPSAYGTYALLFALVAICSTVPIAFLTNSIVRFVPEAIERRRTWHIGIIVYQLAVPAVFGAVLVGGTALIASGITGLIDLTPSRVLAALIAVGLAAWHHIRSVSAYARRQRRLYGLLLLILLSVFSVGAAFLHLVPIEPVTGALSFLALSYLAPVLVFRTPILRFRPQILSKSSPLVWSLVRYGGPTIAVGLALHLNTYLAQFILQILTNAHQVGLYASNYVVADKFVYALASVIALTIEPLLYREWERGAHSSSYRMVWRCVLLFVMLAIGGLAILFLNLPLIMGILTAPDYVDGRPIIPFVAIAATLTGIAHVFSNVLTLHRRTVSVALIYVAAVAVNLTLNLILIPHHGIVGSAYATLISSAALLALVFFRVQQTTGILSELVPTLTERFRRLR